MRWVTTPSDNAITVIVEWLWKEHKSGPVTHPPEGYRVQDCRRDGLRRGSAPLRSRIAAVVDEVDLDDVYATERHLFYVACTRGQRGAHRGILMPVLNAITRIIARGNLVKPK
jgi:hypothetical protein